jgi:hypothetical protein
VRLSDKARFAEAVGSQVLAIALVVALFIVPWWVSAMLMIGVPLAFMALVDALFPPVAAEPFGSAADTRRAAVRFWLFAPLALAALVGAVVAIVRG